MPEPARIFRMVRGMNAILVKGNRVRDFHGHSPNLDVDSGRTKHPQKVLVKVRDRAGRERNGFDLAIVGLQHQLVVEEIEPQLKGEVRVRNRSGREAAGRNIERNVPPVVQPGGKREPNLADDLRPPVERGVSVLPGCKRERRPALRPVAHGGARGFVHVEHDDALRQATAGNGAAS